MGKRGPPKKPTKLRVLQGNASRRPLPKDEAKPETKALPCPKWLGVVGRAKWKQMSPILKRLGLLTEMDGDMLASYCHWFERWRAAEAALKKRAGDRTLMAEARHCFKIVKSLAQQFGMTPSSRTGIEVPPDGEKSDPFDSWMDRRKSGQRK